MTIAETGAPPRAADPRVLAEAGRRRAFAVISHPDAGKSTLTEALARYLPQASIPVLPGGGASLWVRLPGRVADDQLAAGAARRGLAISPGRSFFPAEPPASFIRLSFAAAAHPGDLPEGVRRLAAVLADT